MNKKRNYQLTFNNPIEHGVTKEKLIEILENSNVKYACGKEEIGSETSTHHLHLFIIFESPRSFTGVQSIFNGLGNPHIEVCKGSATENIAYIEKEETTIENTFFEIGIRPKGQGKRTDIALVKELIDCGYSTQEIIDEYPSMMFQIEKIETYVKMQRMREYSLKERNVRVIYIWGAPGTGKTRYVIDKHGYKDIYRVTSYKNPFDNYKGEEILVLDEFRGQIDFDMMLNLIDRYPCELQCRYHNNIACWHTVYIISNVKVENQYMNISNTFDDKRAFLRRIHAYIDMYSKDNKVYYDSYDMYEKGLGIPLKSYECEV